MRRIDRTLNFAASWYRAPCDFNQALIRNFLRIVDAIAFYIVGAVAVMISKQNQRVGDMAAGTLVSAMLRRPGSGRSTR